MKGNIVIAACLLVTSGSYAQQPSIEWSMDEWRSELSDILESDYHPKWDDLSEQQQSVIKQTGMGLVMIDLMSWCEVCQQSARHLFVMGIRLQRSVIAFMTTVCFLNHWTPTLRA